MSAKKDNLELVHTFDAATEKKLAIRKKNISVYAKGFWRSAAQLYGYAFLAGREMLLAKEEIPHGNTEESKSGFQKWLKQEFPKITYRTARRWMVFAESINSKSDTVSLFAGKNLQLDKPKKSFNAKEQGLISDVIPKVMDGKGMLEFSRDCGFIKDAEAPKHTPAKPLTEAEKEEALNAMALESWESILTQHQAHLDVLERLPAKTRLTVFDSTSDTVERLVSLGHDNHKFLAEALDKLVGITAKIREMQKGKSR